MTLDEALAYDAGPGGDLACEHWCDGPGAGGTGRCNCGMERARAVVATLQAAATERGRP